jgi:hypothetical protein
VSKLAAIQRHHGPDDPRLHDLRRDLAAIQLEEYIEKIVAQAPPLSPQQRLKLASLLMDDSTQDGVGS